MEYSEKDLTGIERSVVAFYSVFNLIIFLATEQLEWGNIVSLLYLLGVFVMWFISLNNYFDHKIRGFLFVVIMQLGMILFAVKEPSFDVEIALILCLSVITGLFGVKELIILTGFFAVMISIYEMASNVQIYIQSNQKRSVFIMQVLIILMVEFAVYFWVKKREDTRAHIEETIRNLHAAEQSKTDFLCNVSHELRTPINSICGISEIASKENDLDRIKEEIVQMHLAGKRLLSVVSDVLDFSELQSGKVDIEEETYSVSTTIQDIVGMAYSLKEEKKIEILFNIDPNIPKVLYGDEKKIRRVVLNLVTNAIKFTNEGYVLIGISSRKESYGINLCIEIKDTGIGMKSDDQKRLFTSFTQADASRKRAVGGIGLGLSISQMLVNKMGGIISAKSKIGKGTSIQVVIPQKVVDETPIAEIADKEKYNFAIFFDMEQFQLELIRGAYAKVIMDSVEGVNVRYHLFKNFQDLKRRIDRKEFTHLYISLHTYQANQDYFNELSTGIQIMVVKEPSVSRVVPNGNVIEISKPFNILSLVDAINHDRDYLERQEQERAAGFRAPNTNVLVVDDNAMNLLVAKRLLEEYGIKVTTAISGKQALKLLENPVYDLIFMDHMMPEMDGVETFHHIREMVGSYYSSVPVIALTANAVAGSRQMFLNEGFDDFIEKPIDIAILERKCQKYLPQKRFQNDLFETEPVQDEGNESIEEPLKDLKTKEAKEQNEKDNSSVLNLKIEGLSVKEGMVYCRDEEIYSEMLSQAVITGPDTVKKIQMLFEEENWKDYTIAVHAAKSAMKTIGAMKLSDTCKELEMLGKGYQASMEENGTADDSFIVKIKEIHPVMMEIYKDFIYSVGAFFGIEPKETMVETVIIKKTEEIIKVLQDFEDAAYDFDGDRMKEILDGIEQDDIRNQLKPIYQKLEMTDYISAAESLNKLFTD